MANLLRWVARSGSSIPPNSVQGGNENDGRALYIVRALHNGSWYPGKWAPHIEGGAIGYNGVEKVFQKFEILTLPTENKHCVDLTWHKCERGEVPDNALCVDESMKFYVGRHEHHGGLHPGNIQGKKGTITVTYFWKQYDYKQYEVLVVTLERIVKYKIYNVTCDLDKIEHKTNDKPFAIASQPSTNNSDCESQVKLSMSYNKTTTHNWDIKLGCQIGVKFEIKAGIPFIAEGKCEIAPSLNFTGTIGKSVQESILMSTEVTIKLPPKSSVNVSIKAKNQTLNIPFTAHMDTLYDTGKQTTTKTKGIYENVTLTDFQTTIENV